MSSSVEPSLALRVLTAAAVRSADSDVCTELLGAVKQLRGWIDSFEADVTSRMRQLHATAGATPAADLHTRYGGVSAAEAKRKERRSETIDEAPSFGEALALGEVGAEHIDALAAATAKLNDDVKAALLDHEDDLLADASRMTPEQFGRSCRELARRLERDNGIERNARQRRDTYLSRKLNGATGMIEGRFAFHPELANQVFGAVDREVAAMIKAGERRGDPAFVDRSVDRNQLAAEALGTLVSCGHQQVRPLEADITLIVDAQTVATGELHDHSVCETIDGGAIPPASVRRLICNGRVTPIIVDQHGNPLVMGRTIRHANRRQRRALRGDLPLLCVHRMRRRVRALRDPPHPPLGTRWSYQSRQPHQLLVSPSKPCRGVEVGVRVGGRSHTIAYRSLATPGAMRPLLPSGPGRRDGRLLVFCCALLTPK